MYIQICLFIIHGIHEFTSGFPVFELVMARCIVFVCALLCPVFTNYYKTNHTLPWFCHFYITTRNGFSYPLRSIFIPKPSIYLPMVIDFTSHVNAPCFNHGLAERPFWSLSAWRIHVFVYRRIGLLLEWILSAIRTVKPYTFWNSTSAMDEAEIVIVHYIHMK